MFSGVSVTILPVYDMVRSSVVRNKCLPWPIFVWSALQMSDFALIFHSKNSTSMEDFSDRFHG